MTNLHVFFGGSFAPPHIGHHQLLKRLLIEPEVAHVHLVPTGINPLKAGVALFDNCERKQLVEAWVEHLKRESRELSVKLHFENFELESGSASFTVDSMRALKERYPSSRWILAIGADLLPQLAQWKSIADLLAGVESVWVFQRGGYTLSPGEIPPELRAHCSWRLFPEFFEWVSSSELRDSEITSDALQAKLRPYLLDNVFELLTRLLHQKKRE